MAKKQLMVCSTTVTIVCREARALQPAGGGVRDPTFNQLANVHVHPIIMLCYACIVGIHREKICTNKTSPKMNKKAPTHIMLQPIPQTHTDDDKWYPAQVKLFVGTCKHNHKLSHSYTTSARLQRKNRFQLFCTTLHIMHSSNSQGNLLASPPFFLLLLTCCDDGES